ncbi:hypothetical protein FJT64_007722 [Amphibalanus amphitrite]|uniref:C2H2-type domain-containing protein n=1 Tax=Amphibalanus amphitrite TaxID=1232801 RepID=A0A6A4VP67_AMPAM|nr:hypothetical protein FJT64_007722 [Amphibalanus amphitrite]
MTSVLCVLSGVWCDGPAPYPPQLTVCRHRQVWVLLLTQVVPCPHPRSGHHACSVRRSYVARKIIESRWLPVVSRYNVSLPLQCPLHPARLRYSHLPRRRHGQRWRCPVCGRQFSREVLVEYHHRAEHAAPPDRQVSIGRGAMVVSG